MRDRVSVEVDDPMGLVQSVSVVLETESCVILDLDFHKKRCEVSGHSGACIFFDSPEGYTCCVEAARLPFGKFRVCADHDGRYAAYIAYFPDSLFAQVREVYASRPKSEAEAP